MNDAVLLNQVKTDLGIKNDKRNAELTAAILSAKQRLRMAGVNIVDVSDPLTAQAVKLACRAWVNFQGEAERYESAFGKLADAMALSGDYRGDADE